MSLCKNYVLYDKCIFTYNPLTGAPIPHSIKVGVCLGTKEQDECSCEGNCCNCDFYEHIREKAKQEKRKESIPLRITEVVNKINSLNLSGYLKDDQIRGEIITELLDIKTTIERRNT